MSQQLSPEIYAQLENLRDIHLPEPVSWWPLAIGWWVLIGFILVTVVLSLFYIYYRRRTLKFAALAELSELRKRYTKTELTKTAMATELSVLLHRIAIHLQDREHGVKADKAWCHYLSKGDKGMSAEVAEFISQAPYRNIEDRSAPDVNTLLDTTEQWIRSHA